ncbi:PorV/PorQ family protein [bacterium]|nr:PorV/PorQ family protein [bacterium]
MSKNILLVLICLSMLGMTLEVLAGSGLSAAQVLLQQNGARPAGRGGAFAAASQDIYAIHVNPAGAHDIEKMEIMLMHVAGFEGLSTEYLVGAVPLPDLGTVGLQFLYRSQPAIDNNVPGESAVNVKDMIYGLTFARSLMAGFSIGVNVKLLVLQLGPVDASAFSLDLGTQYKLNDQFTFGLTMRNLGTPIMFRSEEDPLPATLVVGANYVVYNKAQHKLVTALDMDYLIPEENTTLHVGVEYWFQRLLALRAGYVYSARKSVRGPAVGVGFRFQAGDKVDLVLDYTLLPQFWEDEDFEIENLFTFSVKF